MQTEKDNAEPEIEDPVEQTFGFVESESDWPQTRQSKKRMLAALARSGGIVLNAAKAANIERSRHYDWMKQDASYSAAVEQIREIPLDIAESELIQQIKRHNLTAIIFFLKTRGKQRGYIETVNNQLSNPDGTPLFDWLNLSRKAEAGADTNLTEQLAAEHDQYLELSPFVPDPPDKETNGHGS